MCICVNKYFYQHRHQFNMLLNTTAATSTSFSSAPKTTTKMMTKCHRTQRCQMQYHNGVSSLSSSVSTTPSLYGLNKWLWTAVLFGLLIVTVCAKDENSKPSPASTASSSLLPRDEIYIDDEGIDGSGRGGIHDDLEKDHDFSGSGFGPDDEDSDSDYRHNTHKHQTGKSNINKNIEDNDFITTSRNNNQNNNHQTSSNSGINNNNNNQGNTGFISSGGSSATSGNTGLNTIDKTNNNNNNNQQNNDKIIPPPIIHHDDNDDFDIEGEEEEGGILAGSGDGGLIDHHDDNDDDDHTGDVDEDGDTGDILPDITNYQHGIFNSATPSKPDQENSQNHDEDFEEEEDFDHNQPIDHDNDDDEDNDHDDVNVHSTHSEDGTEIYTDITDESSTGSSSSSSSSSSTTEKRPGGGINTQGGTNIHDLDTNSINSLPPETKIIEQTTGNEVLIMNANDDDRTASFFAQPGILAAVIGGAVVGLLCAILVVMFIVYRMRKKDEGSYALDEPKRSPAMNSYAKNATNREFYA